MNEKEGIEVETGVKILKNDPKIQKYYLTETDLVGEESKIFSLLQQIPNVQFKAFKRVKITEGGWISNTTENITDWTVSDKYLACIVIHNTQFIGFSGKPTVYCQIYDLNGCLLLCFGIPRITTIDLLGDYALVWSDYLNEEDTITFVHIPTGKTCIQHLGKFSLEDDVKNCIYITSRNELVGFGFLNGSSARDYLLRFWELGKDREHLRDIVVPLDHNMEWLASCFHSDALYWGYHDSSETYPTKLYLQRVSTITGEVIKVEIKSGPELDLDLHLVVTNGLLLVAWRGGLVHYFYNFDDLSIVSCITNTMASMGTVDNEFLWVSIEQYMVALVRKTWKKTMVNEEEISVCVMDPNYNLLGKVPIVDLYSLDPEIDISIGIRLKDTIIVWKKSIRVLSQDIKFMGMHDVRFQFV